MIKCLKSRLVLFLFGIFIPIGASHSMGLPMPGDFYLIARNDGGDFTGSHKIFPKQTDGLYEVTYCGRSYWVRAHTIAWTQVAVENRKQVRVEFNFGKGWRPICENPDQQVTLADIGVTREAREVLLTDESKIKGKNRFSVISDSFAAEKGNSSVEGSYHRK